MKNSFHGMPKSASQLLPAANSNFDLQFAQNFSYS